MNKEKIDFEIVPIFDQFANPHAWHDFTTIEMKCDSEKYHYNVDDKDRDRIFRGHMYDWKNCKYNIAFAAYHDEKMLGFVTGYKEEKSMYLRNLYVDPQYEGMGIGRSLLDKFERASSLVAGTVEVIALKGAVSFYELHGYTNFDGRFMSKKLTQPVNGVVPVFQWYKSFRAKIKVDVDHSLLVRNINKPIFAYVAPGHEIIGAVVRPKEGGHVVWASERDGKDISRFYKGQLVKALSKIR